jgi:SSS family solute:Na+ symporter
VGVHLPLLLIYSAAQVALGWWIGRRVRGAGDFFVAGRQLGPVLLFSTLVAANIGAGSTVGAAGLGYRDGLSAWWWVGSAGLSSIVLALVVGPRIRRVAAAHDLRTVGDLLELRFGRVVRGTIAALLWVGTLAILAGQLVALSWVLNVVAGIPKATGCLLGGLVMVLYFVAGGLLTSAWVNAVQLTVLLVGFFVALPMAMNAAGGLAGIASTAASRPDYLDFFAGGGSGYHYLALLGTAFFVSPGLLQKVYGARDDRTVRVGTLLNAVVLLGFAFVPVVLGMAARALHPDLANHEMALPTLLAADLPPLVGSLGLAALFSAEVSTADAILFMLSTSLSQDLYRRFVNPGASDAAVLRVARAAAVTGGTLGVALAVVSPTVIGALSIFYSVLSVCLFVPLLAALFVPAARTPEVMTAIVCGMVALVAVHQGLVARVTTPPAAGLLASSAGFLIVFAARAGRRRTGFQAWDGG